MTRGGTKVLRAAKKATPADLDLMSFEPLAAPPAPVPSPAPALFRPAPAPVAAPLADGHEKKKLAILSMFKGSPAPIAAGGGGFFGQYGL